MSKYTENGSNSVTFYVSGQKEQLDSWEFDWLTTLQKVWLTNSSLHILRSVYVSGKIFSLFVKIFHYMLDQQTNSPTDIVASLTPQVTLYS